MVSPAACLVLSIAVGLTTVSVASIAASGCSENPTTPDLPAGPSPTEICLARAVFGDPADSLYILPYPVGASYSLTQSYCGPFSHARDNQLAYDFNIPVGDPVIAARAGIVRRVVDTYADDDQVGSHNNHMFIQHEDGSCAMYAHLMQHSARVREGDPVVAGQRIALSGTSGSSVPHLHFGVYRTWPNRSGDDLPVNFRNTDGALDGRGGLQIGVSYTALPY
jgi:murein DD-endopeptidase MepM/ murein hydrolase activator NlpD